MRFARRRPARTRCTLTATLRSARVCALVVAVWGAVAAVHFGRAGLTLAHYDARAHLVVARRVFDSLTPGWQQVGAVWLPLPHLLNALPVQIDWLYRTGLSGVAISILSMAVAAWALARLISGATGSTAGGFVAAALVMLNPDVLYLQSTPMTEPLLFGTTFLAIALIADWTARVPVLTTPSSILAPAPSGSTRAAGWACVAAVLTRYEAWPIVTAAIGLAVVVLLRRGFAIAPALRAVRGLALWPTWAIAAYLVNSKVTVGSWFVSSGFFVPENPALGRPWLAWTQIWDGLVELTGPALPWAAVASAALIAFTSLRRKGARRVDAATQTGSSRVGSPGLLIVLALAACALLPWAAYFKGHPLRIRYDVPLVAAAAALAGAGVALLPRRLQPLAGIAIVALAAWQAPPFQPQAPVVLESQREARNQEGRHTVTAYLRAHWDGQPIMMSMGSLAHYMHDLAAAGFNVRDFLHEGNGEIWIHAVRNPRPIVEWIAIEERAEGGDALHWQALHDEKFLTGYERVAEGGNVGLYRRQSKDTRDSTETKEQASKD
jgi:hypothetical protein